MCSSLIVILPPPFIHPFPAEADPVSQYFSLPLLYCIHTGKKSVWRAESTIVLIKHRLQVKCKVLSSGREQSSCGVFEPLRSLPLVMIQCLQQVVCTIGATRCTVDFSCIPNFHVAYARATNFTFAYAVWKIQTRLKSAVHMSYILEGLHTCT